MIDRRSFLNTLGASAFLTAVPAVTAIHEGLPAPTSRSRISLKGEWEHRIGGNIYDTITLPSSRRPSGFYSLHRHFE